MKKKLLIIISIVILIALGVLGYFIFNKHNLEDKKPLLDSGKDLENLKPISNDLFGSYYEDAEKIVKEMSLEEKVGQLFLIRYDKNLTNNYINNYHAGGFILFAKDFQYHNKQSIKEELDSLQSSSKLPLAIAVDEEGGYVTRVSRYKSFRSSKFTSPKSYYEYGGYDLLEEVENEKAQLLKSIGININLAPVADISTNPNDFIYSRSFGHNAEETAIFIKNMVTYANNNMITSALKHFPGYGNNVDTHTGVAIDNRSYDNFTSNDFLPFSAGIESKVPFILVSHNVVNCMDSEYPSSLSYNVITKELRQKLKFSGIVITDDLDMDAVKSYAEDGAAATLAINAGADMVITSDFINMYNEIVEAVHNKVIDEEKIDLAAKRIIAWKMSYKLM